MHENVREMDEELMLVLFSIEGLIEVFIYGNERDFSKEGCRSGTSKK